MGSMFFYRWFFRIRFDCNSHRVMVNYFFSSSIWRSWCLKSFSKSSKIISHSKQETHPFSSQNSLSYNLANSFKVISFYLWFSSSMVLINRFVEDLFSAELLTWVERRCSCLNAVMKIVNVKIALVTLASVHPIVLVPKTVNKLSFNLLTKLTRWCILYIIGFYILGD